jgi:hypothetical protein
LTLRDAERTDLELREQLNDLVRTRARAQREAERLGVRAGLPGADAALRTLVDDYLGQERRLAQEVERVRASLRAHEVELERARAAEAGGSPAATAPPAGGPAVATVQEPDVPHQQTPPEQAGGAGGQDTPRQQEPPTGAGGPA